MTKPETPTIADLAPLAADGPVEVSGPDGQALVLVRAEYFAALKEFHDLHSGRIREASAAETLAALGIDTPEE